MIDSTLSPNENLILNILEEFGELNQTQLTEHANLSKVISRPYVSAILKRLGNKGLISEKLSGNGHEKLYGIKDVVEHQPETSKALSYRGANGNIPSQQLSNSVRPPCYQVQSQDNELPPIRVLLDGTSRTMTKKFWPAYDTATGRWFLLQVWS